jgi:8-oxo-dGTP pyrophosphatase MutT (NUDIX family)
MDLKDDPKPWQLLSSRYLHREPWLTVRQDHVRLPNGAQIDNYYVLEYSDWVHVIALTPDKKLVMIRQYRHAIGKTYWELPAGVAEGKDGDLMAAAQRELLEETGYGGGQWDHWMTLSANCSTHSNRSHTFLARNVTCLAPASLESTEEVTTHLLPIPEARKIVLEGGVMQALNAAPLLKFFLLEK